jgi:hypothetical protein
MRILFYSKYTYAVNLPCLSSLERRLSLGLWSMRYVINWSFKSIRICILKLILILGFGDFQLALGTVETDTFWHWFWSQILMSRVNTDQYVLASYSFENEDWRLVLLAYIYDCLNLVLKPHALLGGIKICEPCSHFSSDSVKGKLVSISLTHHPAAHR